MKRFLCVFGLCALSLATGACKTVYGVHRTPRDVLAAEPGVGFLRPDRYTLLGTRSVRDYVEVTYERARPNPAGMTEVQLGLRNRGGQHFWDTKGPAIALSVKAMFYEDPITPAGPQGPPVYETNWQPVRIIRGDTTSYQALCPVPTGKYYQVRITDLVK